MKQSFIKAPEFITFEGIENIKTIPVSGELNLASREYPPEANIMCIVLSWKYVIFESNEIAFTCIYEMYYGLEFIVSENPFKGLCDLLENAHLIFWDSWQIKSQGGILKNEKIPHLDIHLMAKTAARIAQAAFDCGLIVAWTNPEELN